MGIKCSFGNEYLALGENELRRKYYLLRDAFPRICPQSNKRYIDSDYDAECQKIQDCLVPHHSECNVIVDVPGEPMIEVTQDVKFVPSSLNIAKSMRFDDKNLEYFARVSEGEVGLTKTKTCDFSQSGLDNLAKIMDHPGLPKHIAIVFDWNHDPQNTAITPQRFTLDLSNAKDIESVNLNIWKGSGIEIELVLPESAASLVEL